MSLEHTRAPAGATGTSIAPLGAEPEQAKGYKVHRIKVSDLIVHKYEEESVIFRKASNIAQEIIGSELRPGELTRSPAPGVFDLVFPALRKEAGELRASVIAEKIAREIRSINPASIAISEKTGAAKAKAEPAAVNRARAVVVPAATAKPATPISYLDRSRIPSGDDMRRQATLAFDLMAPSNRFRLEELLGQDGLNQAMSAQMSFTPVWNVRKDLVTAYVPNFIDARLQNGPDDEASGDICSAQNDAAVLVRVKQVLRQTIESGLGALMILPVHFWTLENQGLRGAYLEALSNVPAPHRQFLLFEVRQIPADASRFRLGEALRYLRGRCRNALARVPITESGLSRYKTAGFFGLTVEQPQGGDQRVSKVLDKLAGAAEAAHLHLHMTGLSRRALLLPAITAGFEYLSGPAVAPIIPSPAGLQDLEIERIYRRMPFRKRGALPSLEEFAEAGA